jgi:hypothetical protein
MANLSYWNHVLDAKTIQSLFAARFENRPAVTNTKTTSADMTFSSNRDLQLVPN